MTTQVHLNERVIQAFHYTEEHMTDNVSGKPLQKIIIDFNVTSEDYHDIAVLLYGMEFRVQVPERNLDFQAAISNYSTDTTNLYNPNEVAAYHLELTEKV